VDEAEVTLAVVIALDMAADKGPSGMAAWLSDCDERAAGPTVGIADDDLGDHIDIGDYDDAGLGYAGATAPAPVAGRSHTRVNSYVSSSAVRIPRH
jgi:hypothetical protein